MKLNYQALLDRALQQVQGLEPLEVQALVENKQARLIDVRDIREIESSGRIPQSKHVPRGMLEFWLDPSSPYYKAHIFAEQELLIFHCYMEWRSILAAYTASEMGVEKVYYMRGGLQRWIEEGLAVDGP